MTRPRRASRTENGLDRAVARIDQKRAEDACMRAIAAFNKAPADVTFKAAEEALGAYEREYVRWIAPILDRLSPKEAIDG
jgi:hypothetical protein